MSDPRSLRLRVNGSVLALLAEAAHLSWEHFHGGILRHHLLNRADLPAISNLWGLLLLPALVWYLIGRVERRLAALPGGRPDGFPRAVLVGFATGLLFGLLLSGGFHFRQTGLTNVLFQGLLLLVLAVPAYRAECVLGFVLGMSFVFGVALPTLIAAVLATLSMLIHLVLRPWISRLWRLLSRKGSHPS